MLDSSTIDHLEASVHQKQLGQQDFLRLMVAQMKYQQEHNVLQHTSIEQFSSALQSKQALQASALVGRKVLVNNKKIHLGLIGSVNLLIYVNADVSDFEASIYTSSGVLVHQLVLGSPEEGVFEFSWDGCGADQQRLSAGVYHIDVSAICQQQKVSIDTMTLANVDSVSLGHNGAGLRLNVAHIGPIALDQVKQILV